MKKILLLLLAAASLIGPALAQKLVIGSRIPDLKNIQWHTTAPPALTGGSDATRPMLIEFYDPGNPTSNRYFPRLADIKTRHGNNNGLLIVVLTRQSGPTIDQIVRSYGNDYYIGTDPDGKVYQTFNVQYLPYTILVNSKGELSWQGNLGNITDPVLQKIK